jgi:hypothetical protein
MNRDCGNCAYATRIWNGRADELVCANYPGHEGDLSHVTSGAEVTGCRRFYGRRGGSGDTRPAVLDGNVRYISLGDGKSVMVDAADFEWLSRYRWRTTGGTKGYVHTRIKEKTVYMHRLIMNPPAGRVVDHANGNVWDNRRRNLRVCTRAQNSMNSRGRSGTSSIFKGVCWDRQARKWNAVIGCGGKTIYIGSFDDEAEAARAYDRKARELFGKYAYLNFPEEVRYVCLSGSICVRTSMRGQIRVHKSEIRSTTPEGSPSWNCETISNYRNRKSKTAVVASRPRLGHWDSGFRYCLGFGKSCFGFPRGGWAQRKTEQRCHGGPAASRSRRSASCRGSGLPFRRAS